MGHSVTTLKVNTIEPAGSTLTLGASGDSVVLADDVRSNTYKDAGGNTLFTSDGSGNLSSVNSGFGDSIKLLSTQTPSSVSSVTFSVPATYKQICFKLFDISVSTDGAHIRFQGSINGGSSHGVTATSTYFRTYHNENDASASGPGYLGFDLAQSTSPQLFMYEIGNDSDQCAAGELTLYNPASTTYVKHWHSRTNSVIASDVSYEVHTAGYFNDTNDIDSFQFTPSAGTMSGKIKMYGIS